MKYIAQQLDSFRHSLLEHLCSSGAVWLHFLIGNCFAERLNCTQSKETPGAFHVTESPLFSIFNSDISSESVISQRSPGDLKREEREKMTAAETR